jgi:hypothetical protein
MPKMSFLPTSLFGGLNQVLNAPELDSGTETLKRVQGNKIVFPQQKLLNKLCVDIYIWLII